MLALSTEKALPVLVMRSVGNQTVVCKYIPERGVCGCAILWRLKKRNCEPQGREKKWTPMGVRKEGCISRTESHRGAGKMAQGLKAHVAKSDDLGEKSLLKILI